MKTSTTPALYLFLRTDERSSMGKSVLSLTVSACTRGSEDQPNGLPYGASLENVHISERVYAAHPDWSALGELRLTGLSDATVREGASAVNAAKDIQRKLDAIWKQAGPPATLGAAVLRFGNAIRAVGIIRRSPRDAQEWQTLGLDSAPALVDHAVHDFREKHAPKPQPQETAA